MSRKSGIGPEWSWGGMGVVGMGGGSAGCVGAGCHFPRDWFSSATACWLSKSPVQCKGTVEKPARKVQELLLHLDCIVDGDSL